MSQRSYVMIIGVTNMSDVETIIDDFPYLEQQYLMGKFKNLMVGKDLKTSYLCAWNADNRSDLEEEFIKYCDENNLINWND